MKIKEKHSQLFLNLTYIFHRKYRGQIDTSLVVFKIFYLHIILYKTLYTR